MYLRAPFKSGLCHQSAKFLAGQHSQSMSTCITWEDVWRQEEVCPPAPPPADWFHASHQRVEHGSTQILKQGSPKTHCGHFLKDQYFQLNPPYELEFCSFPQQGWHRCTHRWCRAGQSGRWGGGYGEPHPQEAVPKTAAGSTLSRPPPSSLCSIR